MLSPINMRIHGCPGFIAVFAFERLNDIGMLDDRTRRNPFPGCWDADVFDQAARISARCNELTDQIQAADHRMEEITALRQHIFNYSKTRDIFRAYCQCKPKEKAKLVQVTVQKR